MPRWLSTLLLCSVALYAEAQQPTRQAAVSVRLTPAGVLAAFNLDHAVTRFPFSGAEVARKDDIDILTPGVKWSDDSAAVISDRPFRHFEIQIRPATRERDAKYPAFFRVGRGGVLYGPTLKAGDGWRTRLRVITSRNETRVPASKPNIGRSIFIGPAAYVIHGTEADFISSDDTPASLRERVAELVGVALRTYAAHLRIALETRPTVVVAQMDGGSDFRGDVTPGPFVSLRFYGPPQEQTSDANRYTLTRFVMHEAFHFWNGAGEEDAPSWLHEGSADYAALLASLELGALDDAGMRTELGSALTRCRQGLESQGNVGLDELKFLSASVRYPCGIVIQWSASMSAANAGRGGFFDVWSRTITTGTARTDRKYRLSDFYESAGIDATALPNAIHLLTTERGPDRWIQLKAALDALGAEISLAPTADSRRQRLLFHLLEQACGPGPRGFYTEPSRLRLQTNANCTLIPDNSILTGVEGGDVAAVDEATYAAVQVRCSAQEDVRIILEGDRNVRIPCHKDLPPARDAYIVNRWH